MAEAARQREFKPALGKKAYEKLEGHARDRQTTPAARRRAPTFDDGWWSYVSKDLRDLFGPKPKAPWSRVYCGGGSKRKCRGVLRRDA